LGSSALLECFLRFANDADKNLQGNLEKHDDNGPFRAEIKAAGHILAFKIIEFHLRKGKRMEACGPISQSFGIF